MRVAPLIGTLLATTLLICTPSSAVALTFAEAPGSPYSTTDQHFVPTGSGFLGGAVAGDFNGDGISDLAVVNATGLPAFSSGESVTALLGHPGGTLTMAPGSPVELYSGGIYASHGVIAAGDFTNDGHLDLAVVDNAHDTISILLGDGTGRFRLSGAPIPFSGEDPNVIAVGDFTGDGVEDLAFASGGSVNVLLGNGSGGFAPAPGSPFAVAGYARSVATGDFNRDGRSDLAVTTLANQVAIYLATGDGQFQEAEGSPLPPGEGSASIVATDLSGNGRTDLAIANEGSDNVTVLLGNGSGGFTPAEGSPFTVPAGPCSSPSMPGMPQSIAAGDFSGKGNMDLAIANFNGSSDNVAILQGNGRGGFTNAIGSPFPANGNPRSVVVGDFNGDGRPDLAVVNSFQGVVTVLLNTTTAAAREVPLPSPSLPNSAPIINPSTPPLTTPIRAQILTLLAQQLVPSGDWARLRPSAKNASVAFRFSALGAGTATIVWYGESFSPSHGRHAHLKRAILAQGILKVSQMPQL